jgi:hypothetical protein
MEQPSAPQQSSDEIPKEFRQIVRDFLGDLFTSFPEYKTVSDGLLNNILNDENASVEPVFEHVKTVFPQRFFDILYKNDEIFEDEEKNTEFLPGIDFADIWKMDDVSETIRETVWRYLQLIMFSVLETIQSQDSFGDTAKLFEAIDESELKTKIEETVEQMKGLFEENKEGINLDDLPNPDSVNEHLHGLMDGKLGKLATEIAEETAQDFEMDLNAEGDVNAMFKKLFKNPGKLMGLVNTISKKLDTKMKSGDISETDLMKEAGDLMNKMKNMPGMPNIEEMMKNMNVPKNKHGMMMHQFNQNMRNTRTKSRLQRKLEERKQVQAQQVQAHQVQAQQVQAQQVQAHQVQAHQVQAQQPFGQAQQVQAQQVQADSNIKFDGKSFSNGSAIERSKTSTGKSKQGKKNKKK